MPAFVVLIQYTEQGMQTIKDAPDRVEEARKGFEAAGAKLKDFYLTMGEFDAVAIVEAPDDETMAKMSLTLATRGTSRSRTLRAFSEADFRKLVADLP